MGSHFCKVLNVSFTFKWKTGYRGRNHSNKNLCIVCQVVQSRIVCFKCENMHGIPHLTFPNKFREKYFYSICRIFPQHISGKSEFLISVSEHKRECQSSLGRKCVPAFENPLAKVWKAGYPRAVETDGRGDCFNGTAMCFFEELIWLNGQEQAFFGDTRSCFCVLIHSPRCMYSSCPHHLGNVSRVLSSPDWCWIPVSPLVLG